MKKMNLMKLVVLAAAIVFALPSRAQLIENRGSDDFKIGIAGYTFRKFNIDETLKMLKEAGVHYMSIKDFHLPLDSSAEQMEAFKKKLAEYGVDGYTVGPIYMRSEAEVDRAFDYAKRFGVKMLIGVPTYELLPYTEKKVKEYDIRMAIHTHGPDNVLFPDATDAMQHIGNMDPRIGICIDLGHTVRYGANCADDLVKYKDRIFDIHIKDESAASKAGKTWEMGRGVMDYIPIVRALYEIGYDGVCSLEFEKAADAPYPGVVESLGYFRGVCDAVKTCDNAAKGKKAKK